MAKFVRFGLGVLVRGGIVLGAYLLVVPAIWSRADFEFFAYGIGLAAMSGWGALGRDAGPLAKWVLIEVLYSVGSATTLISAFVLIGALFGDDTLTSLTQMVAFGAATATAACFWFWMRRAARSPAFTDPDGEDRRAAIRANVRREIEEIEKAARTSLKPDESSTPRDELPRWQG